MPPDPVPTTRSGTLPNDLNGPASLTNTQAGPLTLTTTMPQRMQALPQKLKSKKRDQSGFSGNKKTPRPSAGRDCSSAPSRARFSRARENSSTSNIDMEDRRRRHTSHQRSSRRDSLHRRHSSSSASPASTRAKIQQFIPTLRQPHADSVDIPEFTVWRGSGASRHTVRSSAMLPIRSLPTTWRWARASFAYHFSSALRYINLNLLRIGA